jgi:sulfur carrier protein ThiS
MNFEKYIGIPYAEKGRDVTGLDCYGLVRLIYKNELKIDLPSFSAEYTQTDTARIEELIAQYKEGWEQTEEPVVGSIVLFRVLGNESHIGVVVNPTHFIHVRENQDTVIESLSSTSWARRKVGYFNYSEKKSVVLNAVPHPLRTERYTMPIVPGTTLKVLAEGLTKEYNIAPELKSKVSVMVNGMVIPQEKWQDTILKEGDTVEYRAVPGNSGTFRMLAMIAIVAFAPQLAGMAEFAYMGTAGASIAGSAAVYTAAYAATVIVGSALINAIAPIRPPVDHTQDPGSAERQLLVTGGANQQKPYGSIPVVLGKVRVTPPLGSTNFLTYENEGDSYISMLLVWGYGPMVIDAATLRIGAIPIASALDINDPSVYQNITANRITELTADQERQFDSIYGKDITQVDTQVELVCDGDPEVEVTPGPWFEAATGVEYNTKNEIVPVTSATVALHFPQGLRKIVVKGEESGASAAVAVNFRLEYSVNAGSSWTLLETFTIGGDTAKKNAFTTTKTYSNLNHGQMMIRARRETGDNIEDNPDLRYYFQAILQNVTFLRNNKPAVDPVGAKIAKSAFKIKATNQLNGSLQGISAVVQTYCKIWNGTAWVNGATSNPAALMRYVLEHPANPRRITDAASQINLTQLQYFYNYCQTRGFEYNGVLGEARSILEVIRDICAAGRASPALVDGKWSVVIDEIKSTVIQHFTPHNSWGFEGSKGLPKRPDGLRVTFYDQEKDYQESEIIVYDIGKNSGNASLFESITLPGVTKRSLVIDHARWHMAQIKLRPEVYTINSDIEYLVCNRGDRVKVMHDIPMWGLGSGRIKARISDTKLQLDEDLPMKAGVTYTMRFRSKTGDSIVRNLVAKSADGYYNEVDLTSGVTTAQADMLDLFLFGELQQEAQDLMVISIEPSANNTARITLVDYGVTSEYNIFTDYQNLTASTVFESQITLPPALQVENFGIKKPIITGFVSDESVMERVSKGVFRFKINVAFVNASQLPTNVESVEVQYDLLDSTVGTNFRSVFVPYQNGSASIADVKESETYKVRMRYVGHNGVVGNWTDYSNHTVVGKTNPPSSVTNFVASADKSSGQLLVTWTPNPESDVYTYEIRTQDIGWGTDDSSRLFFGDVTKAFIKYNANGSMNLFIRAVDTSGNYSLVSTSQTFTATAVPNVPDIVFNYANSQTTGSSVTLSWNEVVNSQFDIDHYEISYGLVTKNLKATTLTVPVDWIGDKTFTIKTVDIYQKKSSGYSETITKNLPSAVTGFTITADKLSGQLLLSWNNNPEPDVSNYEIKTQDNNWGVNDSSRLFFGNNDHLFTTYSGQASVTLYIRSVDFYNNYTATTVTQTFTREDVPNITNIDYSYSDTSLTSATVTLTWSNITLSQFDLAFYEVIYNGIVKTVKANNITIAADWVGDRLFTIKAVDVHGNKSSGYSEIITKLAPNSPTDVRAQVVDNTVMLYWTLPIRTSLPIDHILIKRGSFWDTATVLGDKKGEFTTINESTGGNFTYWLAAVDTEGVQSTPVSVTTLVSEPPDFVFHGEFNSTFTGTKSSATFDGSVLAIPVNTSETFEQHFNTRSWNTPQDQVNAGYPIFIQPSGTTGYYEEVFDFGQPLASSRVLLTYNGTVIAGNPTIVPKISLSLDNSTYIDYNGVNDVFGLNFRYVKIRITVTSSPTNVGLYEIKQLTLRLDAKLKNDAGSVAAVSTDTLGTIVNFNKEFIDVQSVTVSPSATTPVIPVYDIKDTFVSGTYSVSSGVCTVNINNHGIITGQNIKLFINSGSGSTDIYTVISYSTNSFTLNMSVGDTSGGCSMYPQSFRVYLFNNSGTRVSANASWSIKGY